MSYGHIVLSHGSLLNLSSLWSDANRCWYNICRYYNMSSGHTVLAHGSLLNLSSLWSDANRCWYNICRYYNMSSGHTVLAHGSLLNLSSLWSDANRCWYNICRYYTIIQEKCNTRILLSEVSRTSLKSDGYGIRMSRKSLGICKIGNLFVHRLKRIL